MAGLAGVCATDRQNTEYLFPPVATVAALPVGDGQGL
jgi:hypothetical protein